jgi:hypothetical protein
MPETGHMTTKSLGQLRQADERTLRFIAGSKPTASCVSSTDSHWYLVRADQPDHAFIHVRNAVGRQGLCVPEGCCPGCLAEGVTSGSLAEIANLASVPAGGRFPTRPDFAVVALGLHVRSRPCDLPPLRFLHAG